MFFTFICFPALGKKIHGSSLTDVNHMLDHFGIQVSNPCVILMQDTARDFLTTANPKTKYKASFSALFFVTFSSFSW